MGKKKVDKKKDGFKILAVIAFLFAISVFLLNFISSNYSLEIKMMLFNLLGIMILIIIKILERMGY